MSKSPEPHNLLFSVRAALDRAGAPTDNDGAPVSDGWRIKWACDRIAMLEAGDIPDRIRNEPAMYAAYCYAKRERRDEVEELRDRIAALEEGWANARDTILNERHQLAEEDFGSERINMVLGVLDDNYPAPLK